MKVVGHWQFWCWFWPAVSFTSFFSYRKKEEMKIMEKLDKVACRVENWVWENPGRSILGLYAALFIMIGVMLLPAIN